MPSIEVELQQLREVFQRLAAEEVKAIPPTELLPAGGCKIDTAKLILGFLDNSFCPHAIAREILERLQGVGLNRIECTADSIIDRIKNKSDYRDALMDWCYYWILNFLVPLVEKWHGPFGTTMHGNENQVTREVNSRDYNRCAVTGAYDTITAPPGCKGPFATLTYARVIPPHLAENITVKNLTRGFTGGRVDLETDELHDQTNCLILSEGIAGTFRLFQWSLRPERIQTSDDGTSTGSVVSSKAITSSYNYYVETVAARQVTDILQLPAGARAVIGSAKPTAPFCLDPTLCELHAAIGRILEASDGLAPLLRYQRIAPELGIYRIPACIASRPNLPPDLGLVEPLTERFRRALSKESLVASSSSSGSK